MTHFTYLLWYVNHVWVLYTGNIQCMYITLIIANDNQARQRCGYSCQSTRIISAAGVSQPKQQQTQNMPISSKT